MRRMLVDESLSGITEEELRDDEKPDVLFAVEGLLEDVASVAVGCEIDYPSSVQRAYSESQKEKRGV